MKPKQAIIKIAHAREKTNKELASLAQQYIGKQLNTAEAWREVGRKDAYDDVMDILHNYGIWEF